MSGETVSAEATQAVSRPAGAASEPAGSAGRPARRSRVIVAVVVVLAAAAAGAVWLTGDLDGHGSPGSGSASGLFGTSTATVTRQTLVSQTSLNATLGYAGSYTVRAPDSGPAGSSRSAVLTWLPAAGTVIREGQVVYRTGNGTPTYLLYGRVPAWRTLREGMHGQDVAQLNHDLVRLGYAGSGYVAVLGWDYFSSETAYGLERLQHALGVRQTGELVLGRAVFEPGALRVTSLSAPLGSLASGAVFTATSARHVVTIALAAVQQSEVKTGDRVSVTLPDGATTPGVIFAVGKVASTPASAGPGGPGSGGSTISVQVRLDHPRVAGHLVQAPVTVKITTGSVANVLTVPVAALLARPGGYAVEVVTAAGRHHLVKVTPGLFDDAAGLVQVSGPGLSAGQRVVVPGT